VKYLLIATSTPIFFTSSFAGMTVEPVVSKSFLAHPFFFGTLLKSGFHLLPQRDISVRMCASKPMWNSRMVGALGEEPT
jgi:hypothetical protein